MIGKCEEIYLFDVANPAESRQQFHISGHEDRTIIIVYAGIDGKHEVNFEIGGNANAQIIIIPLLWHSQLLNLVVANHHNDSNSKSNIKIVGAVADNAQLQSIVISSCHQNVCDVSIAQKTDILLLSQQARVSAIPAIQSMNMNVQCKHAASSRSFENDQLLYLKARGINEIKVRAILCESFLLSWIDNVCADQESVIRSYIRHIIDAALICPVPIGD